MPFLVGALVFMCFMLYDLVKVAGEIREALTDLRYAIEGDEDEE